MIPRTFQEWKTCIEEKCKIALTPSFVSERLRILQDTSHKETQSFMKHYGKDHLMQIIDWYKQAI